MKILWRTLRAIARYYRLRRNRPQCPYKLAQWIEGIRDQKDCPLTDCVTEASRKFSGRCACKRYQHQH